MLNAKSISIALQIFIIVSSINFIFESTDLGDGSLDLASLTENPINNPGSRAKVDDSSRALIEDMTHGGCWLDTFQNDSGVDWPKTDKVNISLGDARIHIPYYADPYTVGLWHCDEGSGNTINDFTTNHNDGSISGAAWVPGKFDDGLSFDGINDGIDVPDSLSLSITGGITISVWVNFTDLPSIQYPIIRKRDGATDSYQLDIQANGKPRFIIDTGSGISAYGNTAINDGKWHLITATWDKSIMKLYLDGKLDSAPVTKSGNMVDTAVNLRIGYGRRIQGGFSYWDYYKGSLDDIRISNNARSAQDIKEIYENSTPVKCRYANLTTKTILKPSSMHWDTLIINKTQLDNTYLNITIENAVNGQKIPGTLKYIDEGEFDISYIDPKAYPSIKLSASFVGDRHFTPILHYWGVSWNSSTSWKDTLFGGQKIEAIEYSDVDVNDGQIEFKKPTHLISTSIHLPRNFHYDTLEINKDESEDTNIYVTVLDANSDLYVPGFLNLSENKINLISIDTHQYSAIKLKATFIYSGSGTAVLYDWSLNFIRNEPPMIENVTSLPIVNRTHQVEIKINISYPIR